MYYIKPADEEDVLPAEEAAALDDDAIEVAHDVPERSFEAVSREEEACSAESLLATQEDFFLCAGTGVVML